jgi:hypothetical protein
MEASARRRRRPVGRPIRSDLCAAVAACALCISQNAAAETISPSCPEKPEDQASARALAKTWFGKGEALVGEEMYVEALGAFNCSLRMVEHPATMVNAAKAAELAGEKREALDLYERADAATPEAEKKTEISERIAALQAEIAEDEAARKPAPSPVVEPPAPVVDVEGQAQPPSGEGASPGPDRGRGDRRLVVPGYVGIALGGAGVVVGAVLAGLAGRAKSDGESTHSWSEFRDDRDALRGYQGGAIAAFAAGGALLGTGVALVLVGRGREAPGEGAAVAVAVYPVGEGLSVGGTF